MRARLHLPFYLGLSLSRLRSKLAAFCKILIFLTILLGSDPLHASNSGQGKRLALTYCAKCHAIDKLSPSPLKPAPPFRDLHKSYPVETLQEALAEGIVTGHPAMPEFRFDADQVGDFIAFLKTLE
jgi:cytochrome c